MAHCVSDFPREDSQTCWGDAVQDGAAVPTNVGVGGVRGEAAEMDIWTARDCDSDA